MLAQAQLGPQELVVDQVIDGSSAGRFRKEVVAVPLDAGGLHLVRKRGPHRTARGAVVLLHGYAQNRYAWHGTRRSLANYLAHDGFDVFNVDLRGAGRSRELGTPAARGFEDYVEGDLPRIVDAVSALSGERRVFLVGHSLGGAVACAFAGRAPERVRGVVTLAGLYAFGRTNRFVRILGRAAKALESFGVAPYLLPDPIPTDMIGEMLRLSRAAWDLPVASLMPLQAWAPGSIEPDVLEESIRRSFEPASLGLTLGLAAMALGASFCDGRGRCYLAPFEERRDIPLLVMTGALDPLVTSEDSRAAHDRSRSRDKEIRCFDGATGGPAFGHIDLVMGRAAPRCVWPALRDWLRER